MPQKHSVSINPSSLKLPNCEGNEKNYLTAPFHDGIGRKIADYLNSEGTFAV